MHLYLNSQFHFYFNCNHKKKIKIKIFIHYKLRSVDDELYMLEYVSLIFIQKLINMWLIIYVIDYTNKTRIIKFYHLSKDL